MDYCCTVTGNDNCRPEEEMPLVLEHLASDGIVLFTFCKRGVEDSERKARHMVKSAGFHYIETFRYMHTSPMFVLKCMNATQLKRMRTMYKRFSTDYADVDTVNMEKKCLEHMFLCDRCGESSTNGTCFTNKSHTVCETCYGNTVQGKEFTLPDGWHTHAYIRHSGTRAGQSYTIYWSPTGSIFWSIDEVQLFLSKKQVNTPKCPQKPARKRPQKPARKRPRKRPRQSRRGCLGWNARSKMSRKNKHNEMWYKPNQGNYKDYMSTY